MQETRNNCFGSKKCSTTPRQAITGNQEHRNIIAVTFRQSCLLLIPDSRSCRYRYCRSFYDSRLLSFTSLQNSSNIRCTPINYRETVISFFQLTYIYITYRKQRTNDIVILYVLKLGGASWSSTDICRSFKLICGLGLEILYMSWVFQL